MTTDLSGLGFFSRLVEGLHQQAQAETDRVSRRYYEDGNRQAFEQITTLNRLRKQAEAIARCRAEMELFASIPPTQTLH